jgi:hypothetical protein
MTTRTNKTLAEIGLSDEEVLKNRELAKAWEEEENRKLRAYNDSVRTANFERRKKFADEGFFMEPYGKQINMKDAEDISSRLGNYASFPEMANAYVLQNKGNKKALGAFKKMNPIEQRDFIARNVENIFNNQ